MVTARFTDLAIKVVEIFAPFLLELVELLSKYIEVNRNAATSIL